MSQLRNVFVDRDLAVGDTVGLDEVEARHLVKVLRVRDGESVGLLNGRGTCGVGRIEQVEDGRRRCACRCAVESVERVPGPCLRMHLLVAPPRPKHMDFIAETATALGVVSITPVLCERSVRCPTRHDRWEAAAVTALKQSGNPFMPEIHEATPFGEALTRSRGAGCFGDVFDDADAVEWIAPACGDVEVWIGPEGGFTDAEREALFGAGLTPVRVGRWTLRVEIAVPVLLGIMLGGRGKSS